MKRLLLSLLLVTVCFLAAAVFWLTAVPKLTERRIHERTVTVNRLNSELSGMIADGASPEDAIASLLAEATPQAPERITFLPPENGSGSAFTAIGNGGMLICPVYADGGLKGFAVYTYADPLQTFSDLMVLGVLAVCWAVTMLLLLLVWLRILRPFRQLSGYPAHLVHIPDAEKLPETRDHRFGKFVWSLNMLGDVLRSERKRSERLACQRQTLLASIAHGVKTPVTNIRLCAEAIRTGLYDENEGGTAALADRIDTNAQKIQSLVTELITASASSESNYQPVISQFYLHELEDVLRQEYTHRMQLLRIPFAVECTSDRLLHSDLYGLVRMVSQLLENAVKYGNGGGIRVQLSGEDDGVCISVRNKGDLLPEEELPFIFDSFRRGSNAHGIEGSGIGLFTARSIAQALGGSICARRVEECGEMEFTVFIGD
jgi:signal transduction histidine kinase